MAKEIPKVTSPIDSQHPRVKEFFAYLLRMSLGDVDIQAPISQERDDLDAIVHAVNVLVGELAYAKGQAEKANENKSSFITQISHEIRTPLAILLGYLESYDPDLPAEKRVEIIERMKFSTEHTLRLVNQILNFARIDSEKLTLDESEFDLTNECGLLIDGFRTEAKKKSILINKTLEISAENPIIVRTDLQKVCQVMMNLLSNAIRYTETGTIHVTIQRKNYLGVRDALFVRVHDTGIGIPPDNQEAIFLPYRQLSNNDNSEKGLGIGLSISKRLCQFLGGDLFLESSSRSGSVFCFYLPVKWGQAESSQPSVSETISSGGLTGTRILLAEDNVDLRSLFCLYLEDSGATVIMAENGEVALKLAGKNQFDLFLFDIRMPVMDGTTVIQEIRGKGNTTPAVALTAHAHSELVHSFINMGFNDTVSKPFTRDTLIACITNVLKK